MEQRLSLYNSLTRKKEPFQPLVPGHVGLYVCGPTVYGDPHLGHARAGITFDTLVRILKFLNLQVRYVRNVTDVGHLEHDDDSGEDKVTKKARIEKLEPMEIAHRYTLIYRDAMAKLRLLPPSIEPTATGHIIEQIQLIQTIIDAGYAYVSDGNVYFDLQRYYQDHHYGILSGRNPEDLLARTRDLQGQDTKRSPLDFALWKKATPQHIMRWPSPWGDGFPGWHLECSAMGIKYLGNPFDIHGGGMDLMFPHHECEIAQSVSATGNVPARYWVHNNMITINGQKMGKSLGNYITLQQLFEGDHPLLSKPYNPLAVRFFILQAHYRSTLDFSDTALDASTKGLARLQEIIQRFNALKPTQNESHEGSLNDQIDEFIERSSAALLDDMNTPIAIALLFEFAKILTPLEKNDLSISEKELTRLKKHLNNIYYDLLALAPNENETASTASAQEKKHLLEQTLNLILDIRSNAKAQKDYQTADQIRDRLAQIGIRIQDHPNGSTWDINQ